MTSTGTIGSYGRSKAPAAAGYLACAWAFVFGAAHVYWAVGGTVGLQGNSMTGLLLWINLVAIPLCGLAAVVALALAGSWNRVLPYRTWLVAAWGACAVLALRGIVGLVGSALSDDPVAPLLLGYDAWFLLGGVLFGIAAAHSSRE